MELLYGFAPIKAALMQGKREAYGLYYQNDYQGDQRSHSMDAIMEMARTQALPIKAVSKATLNLACNSAPHQGVALKVSRVDAIRLRSLGALVDGRYEVDLVTGVIGIEPRRIFPLLICLDRVQDERNLGSIIRSALFFGADGVLLSGKEACRPSPVVSKTSAGAMECMSIYRSAEMGKVLTKARQNGWSIICTTTKDPVSGRSVALDGLSRLSGPTVLVLGSEGNGVDHELQLLSDKNVHIPMCTDIPRYIDSLNVGVAAGVILSALRFVGE